MCNAINWVYLEKILKDYFKFEIQSLVVTMVTLSCDEFCCAVSLSHYKVTSVHCVKHRQTLHGIGLCGGELERHMDRDS